MKIFRWLISAILPLSVVAQVPEPHYDVPPAVPPASCSYVLSQLDSVTGPPAYQRLAYQIRALESAQAGVSAFEKGMSESNKEKDPALAMSDLFTGSKKAHDALLCSVSISAKYHPVNEATAIVGLF